jgi:hypothetical protein
MRRLLLGLRGLTLGLSISILNLAGLLLMLIMLGGLGGWSTMQFVGVFGVFEIGTAIAFVLCPNVWRLPVIEAETSDRTTIRLAASVVFIPHWAGGAKAIAGLVMVVLAARSEGWGPESAAIAPFALATGILVVATSAIAARWGVARPDIDVVQFVIRQPGKKDREIPGLSLSAAFLQIVLGAFTLPTIKLLPPSVMYQPGIAPSTQFLAAMVALACLAFAGALLAWRGRISLRAPREQQIKAEEPA